MSNRLRLSPDQSLNPEQNGRSETRTKGFFLSLIRMKSINSFDSGPHQQKSVNCPERTKQSAVPSKSNIHSIDSINQTLVPIFSCFSPNVIARLIIVKKVISMRFEGVRFWSACYLQSLMILIYGQFESSIIFSCVFVPSDS